MWSEFLMGNVIDGQTAMPNGVIAQVDAQYLETSSNNSQMIIN